MIGNFLSALILDSKQCGQQGRRSKIKDVIACVFHLMIYNFDHKFPDTHLNAMCSCCLVGNCCPAHVRNGIKILQFIIFLALSHGLVVWMEFEVLGTRSTKYHEMLGSTQWSFFPFSVRSIILLEFFGSHCFMIFLTIQSQIYNATL